MANRALANALQLALAGATGGFSGLVQARSREQREMEARRAQERQQSMDVMGLQERGYTTAEQYAKQRQGATARGGQVASQALLSALNPMAGAPPVAQVTGEDVSALSRALAMPEEPGQRLSMYGQEFVRAESPMQREERLAGLEGQRQTMATREAQRARLEERKAEIEARRQQDEDERRFTRERDAAKRAFDAAQNRLDREARAAASAPPATLKPPTEAQERNAVYYDLMSNAQQELEALKDNPEIRPWAITAYLNTPGAQFGRGLLSDAEQQFIRAAQDFTAGVLRKETGAAATRGEVAQTLERYIQMGGEQPGSAQAKSDARRRVTSAMELSALPALRYRQQYAERPPISNFDKRP